MGCDSEMMVGKDKGYRNGARRECSFYQDDRFWARLGIIGGRNPMCEYDIAT